MTCLSRRYKLFNESKVGRRDVDRAAASFKRHFVEHLAPKPHPIPPRGHLFLIHAPRPPVSCRLMMAETSSAGVHARLALPNLATHAATRATMRR
jgi:hypothetical protein